MERKIIIVKDSGVQEILSIPYDAAQDPKYVIWDEKIDGPLTDEIIQKLGGLTKDKDTGELLFDQATKDLADSAKLGEEKAILDRKTAKDAAYQLLLFTDLSSIKDLSGAIPILQAIKDILL